MKHKRAPLVPDIAAIRRGYSIASPWSEYRPLDKEKVADEAKKAWKAITALRTKAKTKRPKPPPFTVPDDDFYLSPAWRDLRYRVLKYYGARCHCCGRSPRTHAGLMIEVDHIKPRSRFPALQLTFSNMQILCRDCNQAKGGHDSTDWRAPKRIPPKALEAAREARRLLPPGADFEAVATAIFFTILEEMRRD